VGVIDSVMAGNYNRNAGLALDPNLALMLRCGTHRLASVLEREAHMFALKLKCEASQACICVEMWSYTSSRFNVERRP